MERLLTISKDLSQKVESNEGAANELLQQCEELQQKVKAMIQYQNVVQEISGGNDHPRGPPRIEFSYIRQLQQDNSELRSLLEEHEATLEMIMKKYREQMKAFLEAKKLENSMGQEDLSGEVRTRTDQLYHMAAVMYQSAKAEDVTSQHLEERLAQLEYENRYLREVLSLSSPLTTNGPQELSTEENKDVIRHDDDGLPVEQDNCMPQVTSDSEDSRSSTPRNCTDSS